MSNISDISAKLGDYMLKGWVLTDKICATPSCNVPLMRSPKSQSPVVHLCVNCNTSGDSQRASQPSDSSSSGSSARISLDRTISRSSTPPTEASSSLSSPTFALPEETPESRRRREQSDRASTELGNRLLRGWAMLGDECPNSQCFGVPLVRPPNKSGGEKDPRKECVICGRVYMSEGDWADRNDLLGPEAQEESSTFESNVPIQTSRIEPDSSEVQKSRTPGRSSAAAPEKQGSNEIPISASFNANSASSALATASQALEQTLISLSRRLSSMSESPILADPHTISSIVDTISKTTQALSEVRKLQWNDAQASAF